ncbi:MAG: AIR synthase-related protein, partial [Alphaproteobacteria bacterium]
RMLMIVKPEKTEFAKQIFDKWGLDFAVIGVVTDTGRVVIKMDGEIYADIPSLPLSQNSPEYDRPYI